MTYRQVAARLMMACVLAVSAANCQEPPTSAAPQPQGSVIPEGEAKFIPEELEDYYLVYANADVHYLRTVFDAYLRHAPGKDAEFALLKKWNSEYYKSKFAVLSRDENPFGGALITLIFQDKPDKVFVAWVYPEGAKAKLNLRAFELGKFNDEDVRRIRVRYKAMLEDKKHAM